MTPNASRISPPISQMEQARLAHPVMVLPPIQRATLYTIIIRETRKMRKPRAVIIRRGLMDREVTPSRAKAIIFFNGYLLSPANRSPRSYSTVSVR